MSSGSIFKPRDLHRFESQGRGRGTFERYIPWHRVRRSDPSSKGRSHLQKWRDRQRELLSDQELVAFLLSTMHPNVIDIREQFPLNLHECHHEVNEYRSGSIGGTFVGTIDLAVQLKIKHPELKDHEQTEPWIMTTDLLLTLRTQHAVELLAVSVKPANAWQGRRTRELLELEREYWSRRQVPWLLITPSQYAEPIGDLVKGVSHWALGAPTSSQLISWLTDHMHAFDGRNLTYIIQKIAQHCGCDEGAKLAFWQALWAGNLPFDLRRGWRPSAQFTLLGPDEFWELNPIVSRRSAWPV